jgi:hypothetical protein
MDGQQLGNEHLPVGRFYLNFGELKRSLPMARATVAPAGSNTRAPTHSASAVRNKANRACKACKEMIVAAMVLESWKLCKS